MKTAILKSTCIALLMGNMFSCDVLDVEPLDSYTEDGIFTDANLTESYVTMNYTKPRNGWSRSSLRFVCDESMENFNWASAWSINTGGLAPDQLGGLDIWSDYYANIKNCNIFFSNMDKVETIDEPRRSWLIGEATFFRAYYYMELVNNYGGVPLITRLFELDDPEMMIKRNTYEDCVDFIVSEFQKASELLPEKFAGENFGRVTKGAALAMKSRMLLYAASPLWNPANDKSKWEAAAKAAEEVMKLGYSLDTDYKGLFLNPMSSEIIFQRLYNTEFGHWYDWYNSTNGWGGYSCTAVLQEMVDSYEMEDGTMPDPALYTSATTDPWAGRDPRLYASVVCDGQLFRGTEVEFWVNNDGKTGGIDSEFGKDGNLKDWWTAEDAKRFEERAQVMVNFFDSIQVLPGLNANGSLTLGENIADHGGLQVSFQAFKNATKDAPLPVKDGFTPEQRFFLSYAGVWAGNIRDEQIRLQTKSDPHSLGRWRVNGALPQIGAWYDAFGIKEGDPMYLAPEKRVSIW